MKIKIARSGTQKGTRQTDIIDATADQRIPIHLPDNITISRDGEAPEKITPTASGVIVEWKDGFSVVLVPDNGESPDAVKQSSINGSVDDAPLDPFMAWVAPYNDDPLYFAPLPPYELPFEEAARLDTLFIPEDELIELPPVIPPPPSAPTPFAPPPIIIPNLGPTIEDAATTVSEEGLDVGGSPDTQGSPDTTDSATFSGTLTVSDPENDPFTLVLHPPPQAMSSGNVPLNWTGDNTNTLVGSVNGTPIITITIDNAGNYTVTLQGPLDHPLGGVEDTITFAVGVTVTGPGGQSADATLTVTVEDDSPEQNSATINVSVDEDELATALSTGITDLDATNTVATFSGADILGLVSSGADRPVKVSFNSAIEGVNTGLDSKGLDILFQYADATHINGVTSDARTVFTLVQTAGLDNELGTSDDVFTFTLLDQVDHTLASGEGGTQVLSLAGVFVATDFDGDSVVIDDGATVTIENDVPGQNTATVNINVDEDELTGLSTGITDNDSDTTTASFTAAQIAGLAASGADEPLSISFNSAIDDVDTGLDSKGFDILFEYVDATHINGVADGRTVFTLVQTAGGDTVLGTSDDVFTFTLLDQVDHTPLGSGTGDGETIVLNLAGVFVATDFDGDSLVIDDGATVTIENDVPGQNTATVNINVDEDELTGLSTGITDNDSETTTATFSGADILGLADNGADEPLKVSFNAAIDGVDTGLDSKGVNILFEYVSATQINGVTDEVTPRTVFTLVQTAGLDTALGTADDVFTFTLLDQVDHTPLNAAGGDNETIVLSLASVFSVTDFDGDSLVIGDGATVTIENDVPGQNNAVVSIDVDEDELSTGNTDGDSVTTTAAFTGAQIIGLADSGADEPLAVSLNSAIEGIDTGLDSQGANIIFKYIDATHVNGVTDDAGARTVFTLVQTAGADLTLGTADDVFTFTLLDEVDHVPLSSGAGDSEIISLSLANVFQVTDFDGDSLILDTGASVNMWDPLESTCRHASLSIL